MAIRHSAVGSDLHYFPTVDSTNRVARELGPGHWRIGTVVITDYQEAGRGRQGRSWVAPPCSSVLVSVLLEVPQAAMAADMSMVGALAGSQAIDRVTGLEVEIKWPNDLLVRSRKVAGILAEHSKQGGVERAVLGIGINVNFDPLYYQELPVRSTSLQAELRRPVSREDLLIAFFESLDSWYSRLTRDPDAIFSCWKSRLCTIGRRVHVFDTAGNWNGTALGVRRDGALQVRDGRGDVRSVLAADVSIRARGSLQDHNLAVE